MARFIATPAAATATDRPTQWVLACSRRLFCSPNCLLLIWAIFWAADSWARRISSADERWDFRMAVRAFSMLARMALYIWSDCVPTVLKTLLMSAEFFSAPARISFWAFVYFVASSESSTYIVPTGFPAMPYTSPPGAEPPSRIALIFPSAPFMAGRKYGFAPPLHCPRPNSSCTAHQVRKFPAMTQMFFTFGSL